MYLYCWDLRVFHLLIWCMVHLLLGRSTRPCARIWNLLHLYKLYISLHNTYWQHMERQEQCTIMQHLGWGGYAHASCPLSAPSHGSLRMWDMSTINKSGSSVGENWPFFLLFFLHQVGSEEWHKHDPHHCYTTACLIGFNTLLCLQTMSPSRT